jgi:4'-phosphopantetheinyl transferase EntD
VSTLQECLRRAVERDRLADDFSAQAAEVERLKNKVIHLEARVKALEAVPAADVTVSGCAPLDWSLAYHRKTRCVVITRSDGVQIGFDVEPHFWPEKRS